MTAVPPLLDAIGLDAPVTDAPVTTVEYDGDQARPLQDIPRTRLWARLEQVALAAFIAVPLLAVAASGVVLWGNGLSWRDVVLSTVFYAVSGHGITVGFHRYFTHGSFKTRRPPRRGPLAVRHQCRAHPRVREARVGDRRAVGAAGAARRAPGREARLSTEPQLSGTRTRHTAGMTHVVRVRMTGTQRRQQLLDVGRALFAERGYDGTSVEEIALRAGVSKPVVYEHFGGKEGLYAVVVDREVERLLTSFTGALSADSPRRLLQQATMALLTYVEDHADGFRILVRESPAPLADSGGFATIISDVATQVEHILAAEFTARGFRSTLAGLYSQALVGQVALVGQWWLDSEENLSRDEVAAHLVNLAWNGLSALETEPQLRR